MGGVALVFLVVALLPFGAGPAFGVLAIERVNLGPGGVQDGSGAAGAFQGMSADGRFVVFTSDASNLVLGDTNGTTDVFVRDRLTGTTRRASVSSLGDQGNGASGTFVGYSPGWPAISADGRYVAFASLASNLVPADTNNTPDVFVHDMLTGVTTRESVAWDGGQAGGPSLQVGISANGRYVVFSSQASTLVVGDSGSIDDVFVRDRVGGTTNIASVRTGGLIQGNLPSLFPVISGDGRYVAFMSPANNLVAGDANSMPDVFVHDMALNVTKLVSIDSFGGQGNQPSTLPAISSDGRVVAFISLASNLVGGDSNGKQDVFVHDMVTGATTRASVSSTGTQANEISGGSNISANGRYVTFESFASNLVAGDANGMADCFMHDMVTATTSLLSATPSGTQSNNLSTLSAISSDGRYASFASQGTNLVAGDTNSRQDVFAVQLKPSITTIARTPSGSSLTYKRTRGVVTFTLSAVVKGDWGAARSGASVQLQSSPTGKSWSRLATLKTSSAGKISRALKATKAGTTYYRWYLPESKLWVSVTTSAQKVVVK